eukprot:s8119_g2.t1
MVGGSRTEEELGRCGEHAAIPGDPKAGSPLSRDEMSALRSIVFESGGFRTIQQCVRHWERLETWARSQNILAAEVLVKYLLDLSDRGCGPKVTSGSASCFRRSSMAIAEKRLGKRFLYTLALVAALERFVAARFRANQFVLAFFAWWVLIVIYSSLRFDDTLETLVMKDEALCGVVWQTKDGWSAASFEMDDRDYFMKELESADRFADRLASYQRSILWLRYVLTTAASDDLKRGHIAPEKLKAFLKLIQEITWHSCRVTLLAAAVQTQEPDKDIRLQANWKDPSQLVLKYARSRKEISIEVVKRLTTLVDSSDCSLTTYITKARSATGSAKDLSLKYHGMYIDGSGSEPTICGRYKITECEDLGEIPPSTQMCSLCSSKIFAEP